MGTASAVSAALERQILQRSFYLTVVRRPSNRSEPGPNAFRKLLSETCLGVDHLCGRCLRSTHGHQVRRYDRKSRDSKPEVRQGFPLVIGTFPYRRFTYSAGF